MPSRPAKKFNARFPPARIKKIMQADEQIGKVAAAVPIIVSRSLESFAELLLKRINDVTTSRNAKTVTPSHIKQVIMSDARFHFLHKYVEGVPDLGVEFDVENNAHVQAHVQAHGHGHASSPGGGGGGDDDDDDNNVCPLSYPAFAADGAGCSLAEMCVMTGVGHQ